MALLRISRNPSRRQLLIFSLAWAAASAALAVSAHRQNREAIAVGFGAAAVLMPLAWATIPPFVRGAYLTLSYVTYPIGFATSYAILALLYYGVFTPIGLLMRACGRDPLDRRFEPNATTYWKPREIVKSTTRYLRQS